FVRVELRALNHRHQDVRLRLGGELAEHSFFVEQLARKHLGRGRFDVSARSGGGATGQARVATERLRSLYQSLSELGRELGSPVSLDALLSQPGVWELEGADGDAVREALEAAFARALTELDRMRTEEGRALHAELTARLAGARELVARLARESDELVVLYRERLRERLSRLLADAALGVNEGRLEHEVALLADRSDITEELVRLESHFTQMASLLDANEPVGRKLDFLFQEMGREANTIGSKSQHAPLAHLVVELKAELERMREQVQNID
ncbi:MAG TPA: YicC/YloC family endoribonuclease, partial [Polyangiaceae bacterium]|nr:YicC/YloC family endoribonuclease [Polyangiaceae bacterium]